MLSRPRFALFEVKRAPFLEMLPLALVLCGAVILPNFSLAYASIPFYQIVRESLTLIVAAMNLILKVPQPAVPRTALASLIPICIGTGLVTYYQYHAAGETENERGVGITAAFFGVLVSACYTTSTDMFQERFQMDKLQLAFNQAPLAAVALLYIVPWTDTFPVWGKIPMSTWATLLMVYIINSIKRSMLIGADGMQSGVCTCINTVSQARIAVEAGTVSDTVAARVTTIAVVTIGSISDGNEFPYLNSFGFVLAIGGFLA